MPREDRATWKSNYFLKIIQLLDDYPKCFIVGADNVGSKQMQQIRMSLCRNAVVLMGKNTMMRKAIRGHLENNPALEKLLPHIRGNVGFVFTKEDLSEIRDMLLANKVPAAARAGAIAPCEVTVPALNTGLGPEKTFFFQALEPRCPSIDEWIKKMWCIHTHSGILLSHQKNETLPFTMTWMELKGIMLSKISQSEKDNYHISSLICGIFKKYLFI
uniref:Large ribosomal subunit protein uL10 n=1 Tax=Canis lupus familiaris TaxID=9615 RepID=A0A8P0SQQ8_CANLF